MTIFPSAHERTITIAILSFCFGLSFGVAVLGTGITANDVVPALFTLIAAFVGAWVAFALEAKSRKYERREIQLESANKLLFALSERLSSLRVFQHDFIDPVREKTSRMFEMQPFALYRDPQSKLDAQSVAFLFQSKYKPLLLGLNAVNDMFNSAVDAIRVRSDIHLNTIQPLLEQAGFVLGQGITSEQIHQAVGDRNYHVLRTSTDILIDQVDNFILGGDELRKDLIAAFSEVFSEREVFGFELLDKPVSILKIFSEGPRGEAKKDSSSQ
ncbi:hypothetical protein [Sedimenticola sp.]|uniref:hypothetical protein n=1 Tax=Sedimenticola sp. TaxID=1940285 RepID=UPI003D0A98CA